MRRMVGGTAKKVNEDENYLQSGVLGFGFFHDRDVEAGVFPEGEEVLVRGL